MKYLVMRTKTVAGKKQVHYRKGCDDWTDNPEKATIFEEGWGAKTSANSLNKRFPAAEYSAVDRDIAIANRVKSD